VIVMSDQRLSEVSRVATTRRRRSGRSRV